MYKKILLCIMIFVILMYWGKFLQTQNKISAQLFCNFKDENHDIPRILKRIAACGIRLLASFIELTDIRVRGTSGDIFFDVYPILQNCSQISLEIFFHILDFIIHLSSSLTWCLVQSF